MINEQKLIYDMTHGLQCYIQEGPEGTIFYDAVEVLETIEKQQKIVRYSIDQVVEAIRQTPIDIVEAIEFRDWDMLTDLLKDFIGGAE